MPSKKTTLRFTSPKERLKNSSTQGSRLRARFIIFFILTIAVAYALYTVTTHTLRSPTPNVEQTTQQPTGTTTDTTTPTPTSGQARHNSPESMLKIKFSCDRVEGLNVKVTEVISFKEDNTCLIWGLYKNEPIFIAFKQGEFNSPPGVFIYSHGQYERVAEKNTKFGKKLQDWGRIYANSGYVFIAPHLGGDNWGNQHAINMLNNIVLDLNRSIYKINKEDINLIAFSMGGLAAYRYIKEHPEFINRTVVLAGTVRPSKWTAADCQKISMESIVIYHGNKDVNVPLSLSKEFVKKCSPYVKDLRFFILDGYDHWKLGYTRNKEILLGVWEPENWE